MLYCFLMNTSNEKSVVIKIRFPRYLYEWIKEKATKEHRYLAQQIAYYIDLEYEKEKIPEKIGPSGRADGRENKMGAEGEGYT